MPVINELNKRLRAKVAESSSVVLFMPALKERWCLIAGATAERDVHDQHGHQCQSR